HLVVDDAEDRVSSPLATIGRAALRLAAAAPFVGEENRRAVVVERRRVPVREVRVSNGGDAHGMSRVANVEQESVAFTRTAGQSDRRVHCNVVALRRSWTRGAGWRLRSNHA